MTTSYNAFYNQYDPDSFPVFCDHSVLETNVEGIGKIRVCNGMELTNARKGLNKNITPEVARAISENLGTLDTLTEEGFEAIKTGLKKASETDSDENEGKLITIDGEFPTNYKKLIGKFAKSNNIKLNGNGDAVNEIVLGALGFKFSNGKATGLKEVNIFQPVFDRGIIPSLMKGAKYSEEPSGILVENLNKSLKTLSSDYINQQKNRFDKYFILLGELFQLQNMGGFKTSGNIYNGQLTIDEIMSHIVVKDPDVVVMVEPFDANTPSDYSKFYSSEGTGLLILKKGEGEINITHTPAPDYHEYRFKIGGKTILAVHSKVDPTKDSLESYLNGVTEDVVCGDFNLTKSKGGSNISEVDNNNFSKTVPSFQVRKEKHNTNVIMNNQMHKSGVTDEMDGMAIFVRTSGASNSLGSKNSTSLPNSYSEKTNKEGGLIEISIGGGRRRSRRGGKGKRKSRRKYKNKSIRNRRSKRGKGRRTRRR